MYKTYEGWEYHTSLDKCRINYITKTYCNQCNAIVKVEQSAKNPVLFIFDSDTQLGPRVGLSRKERYLRAETLGLDLERYSKCYDEIMGNDR